MDTRHLRLLPGRGPLLRAADRADAETRRRLERLWTRGDLVRLAPAVYCPAQEWRARPPWDRHALVACAVTVSAGGAPVFTGLTAAHLHGLPVAEVPPTLTVRAPKPGHTVRRPVTSAPYARALLLRSHSAGTRLPPVPDLAPRWNLPSAPGTGPREIEARLGDGTPLGPVAMDPLAAVQLTVASTSRWWDAIPVLDGLLRREPVAGHRWAAGADERLPTPAARRRFHAAWDFADGTAESPGESRMRVLIHDLGFAPPVLQRNHVDERGAFIARTDFWWDDARVAGEFDGIGKYDVDLHADPLARRTALRDEKRRDVRLQRVACRVLHWTWEDLGDPAAVARTLRDAGVPRRTAT